MINQPDSDAAASGSLAGVLSGVLQAFLRDDIDDMLPAIVEAYDAATNRARVRPIVKMLTTDGQRVPRASVASVPVFRFGAGGFFIAMPVKAGDFGWIKANDRDTSLILQQGPREEIPNTATFHSFQSAMFFPDTFRAWAIDGSNSDAMVLQSLDGAVCIALHAGKLTVKAPEWEIDVATTTWKGDLNMQGQIDLTVGSITDGGKDVGKGHKHSGVQTGSGESGPPV